MENNLKKALELAKDLIEELNKGKDHLAEKVTAHKGKSPQGLMMEHAKDPDLEHGGRGYVQAKSAAKKRGATESEARKQAQNWSSSQKEMYSRGAKEAASQSLAAQRAMPKPNLPKSEKNPNVSKQAMKHPDFSHSAEKAKAAVYAKNPNVSKQAMKHPDFSHSAEKAKAAVYAKKKQPMEKDEESYRDDGYLARNENLRMCMKKDAEMHAKWKARMAKDDKPHAPNTPEDKAHDVVEEKEPLNQAIKEVHGSKEKMLDHLRTLKDPSQLRSDENKKAGKEK